MRFEVLGRLAVWDGSTELDIPGAKQRALLAYLLVNGGRLVPADRIIEDLWGDAAPSKARNALQAKVSSLRRALAPADTERGRRLLEARDGGYRIGADEDAVDADRFAGRVARARGALEANHPARAYALLEQALTLWAGEPLPELRDYPFAAEAADRYRALWLNAVEMHATAWLAVGGRPGLPDELAKVLAEHPLRESLRALLMRTLAREARQVEALQVYRTGRRLLREELGIDPGAELESAHANVFAQHDQVAPDADTGHGPVGWLPAESTEFIGRGQQRQHLQDLLARERLVTVTGPGGIGKTRLVVHTLTRLTEPAEGVWFTDLGPVASTIDCPTSPASIADAVLRTFRDRQGANLGSDERLTTDSQRSAVERLRDRIGSCEMVLVLDGCEHVVSEVAELAGYLLAACPELRLVVTTRVLLGLAGEAVLRLEPLALPPVAAARNDYLAAESVALFCTRARLDAEALSEAEFADVAAIVRRTDGIPLAMEVAAGLLGGLTLSDLVAHLRADEDFLQHGSGSTLIETIERSWRLLGEQERDLLARLSLIEGSWSLDAAHALAPDGARGSDLARLVAGLVDRSLISYDPGLAPAPYRLLDTIRTYARRWLADHPEIDAITAAHAEYFHGVAARYDWLLRCGEQPRALRALGAANADLVAALAALRDLERVAGALDMACSLGWFWWLSGRRREGRAILESLLRHAGESTPGRQTASAWRDALALTDVDAEQALRRCLAVLSSTPTQAWDSGLRLIALLTADHVFQRGEPERGGHLLERINTVAERLDDEWYTAAARLTSGIDSSRNGSTRRARHHAETARAGFVSAGDRWGELQALDLLAGLDEMEGAYQRARAAREDMAGIAEELGMRDVHAYQVVKIGNLLGLSEELDAALRFLRYARDLGRQLGKPNTVAYANNGLGLVLRRAGHVHDAVVHHEAALRHYRGISSHAGTAFTCAAIGLASAAGGDTGTAHSWHMRSLQDAVRTRDRRAVALALEGLALTVDESGKAATLLATARELRAGAGAPRPRGEIPEVDRVEAGLGEPENLMPVDARELVQAWAADIEGIVGAVSGLLGDRTAYRVAM